MKFKGRPAGGNQKSERIARTKARIKETCAKLTRIIATGAIEALLAVAHHSTARVQFAGLGIRRARTTTAGAGTVLRTVIDVTVEHGRASLATVSGVSIRALANLNVASTGRSRVCGHSRSQDDVTNGHRCGVLLQRGTDQDALNVGQDGEDVVPGGHMDSGTLHITPLSLDQGHNIDMAVGVLRGSLPSQSQPISADQDIIATHVSRANALDAERQVSTVRVQLLSKEGRRQPPVQVTVGGVVVECQSVAGKVRIDVPSLLTIVAVHHGVVVVEDVHRQLLAVQVSRLALGGHTRAVALGAALGVVVVQVERSTTAVGATGSLNVSLACATLVLASQSSALVTVVASTEGVRVLVTVVRCSLGGVSSTQTELAVVAGGSVTAVLADSSLGIARVGMSIALALFTEVEVSSGQAALVAWRASLAGQA